MTSTYLNDSVKEIGGCIFIGYGSGGKRFIDVVNLKEKFVDLEFIDPKLLSDAVLVHKNARSHDSLLQMLFRSEPPCPHDFFVLVVEANVKNEIVTPGQILCKALTRGYPRKTISWLLSRYQYHEELKNRRVFPLHTAVFSWIPPTKETLDDLVGYRRKWITQKDRSETIPYALALCNSNFPPNFLDCVTPPKGLVESGITYRGLFEGWKTKTPCDYVKRVLVLKDCEYVVSNEDVVAGFDNVVPSECMELILERAVFQKKACPTPSCNFFDDGVMLTGVSSYAPNMTEKILGSLRELIPNSVNCDEADSGLYPAYLALYNRKFSPDLVKFLRPSSGWDQTRISFSEVFSARGKCTTLGLVEMLCEFAVVIYDDLVSGFTHLVPGECMEYVLERFIVGDGYSKNDHDWGEILHVALSKGHATPKVVTLICKNDPSVVSVARGIDGLPLHWFLNRVGRSGSRCCWGEGAEADKMTAEILDILLEHNRAALYESVVRWEEPIYPLEMALSQGSAAFLKHLLDAFRSMDDGLRAVDVGKNGLRNLWCSCKKNCPLIDVVIQLAVVSSEENVAEIFDNALLEGLSEEAMRILTANPACAKTSVSVDTGDIVVWRKVIVDAKQPAPAADALRNKRSSYRCDKEFVVKFCVVLIEHDRSLFVPIMAMEDLAEEDSIEILRELSRVHPDWMYDLCTTPDAETHNVAIQQTPNANVRAAMYRLILFCGRYEQHPVAPLHRSATALVMLFSDHGAYNPIYDTYVVSGFRAAMQTLGIDCEDSAVSASDCALVSVPDGPKSNKLTRGKFIEHCERTFGKTRKVVIKFLLDKAQFDRERNVREMGSLDNGFVLQLLDGVPNEVFAAEVRKGMLLHLPKYYSNPEPGQQQDCYGLVMPAADRSLDAIFRSERPSISNIRYMMHEVGLALLHCHSHQVVHGDLKMLNVLRVDGKMRLIDLDAAAKIEKDSYVGAKFSSGVLPPEMFAELSEEGQRQFTDYWLGVERTDAENNNDSVELWAKISPRMVRSGAINAGYIVKTFKCLPSGTVDRDGLVMFDPVQAHASFDVWSYGLLLYFLITSEPLCPVNRDDDLSNSDDYRRTMLWTAEGVAERVSNMINSSSHFLALDLLLKLLQPDPRQRITMKQAMEHPFFHDNAGVDSTAATEANKIRAMIADLKVQMRVQHGAQMEAINCIKRQADVIMRNTRIIAQLSNEMVAQISRTERVLLKGMFEVADVSVPSCFVILNQRLEPTHFDDDMPVVVGGGLEKAERWGTKLANLSSAVASAVATAVSLTTTDGIMSRVNDMFAGEELWLYLVDEFTLQPVVACKNYPICITRPTDDNRKLVQKIMPLMMVGMKALTVLNTGAKLARCLGYPVPVLSTEFTDKANAAVGGLDSRSSVQQFDVLQSVLDENGGQSVRTSDARSVRGAALREFASFLAKEDPDCLFAGLMRVATEQGECCWTAEDNISKIEAQSADSISARQEALRDQLPPPPVPCASVASSEERVIHSSGLSEAQPADFKETQQLIVDKAVLEERLKQQTEAHAKALAKAEDALEKQRMTIADMAAASVLAGKAHELLAETMPMSLYALKTEVEQLSDSLPSGTKKSRFF